MMSSSYLCFLALCLLTFAVDAQNLLVQLQTSALNDFITVFKSSVLPQLIRSIAPAASSENGVLMTGFDLLDAVKMDVAVETVDTSQNSTMSARAKISVKLLQINIAALKKDLVGLLGNKCTLKYRAEAVAGLSMVYDIGVVDSAAAPATAPAAEASKSTRAQMQLSLASVELLGTKIALFNEGSGTCGLGFPKDVIEWVDDRLNTLLNAKIVAAFRSELQSFTVNAMDVIQSLGGDIIEDKILIGRIEPAIRVDRLYSTTSALSLGLASSLEATLNRPAWRAGRRYQPLTTTATAAAVTTTPSNVDTASEIDDDTVDFRVTMAMDSVNALLSVVWYMFWAALSDDPASEGSALCVVTPHDACAFPPKLRTIQAPTVEHLLLRGIFPQYRNFRLETVVDPPSLSYSTALGGGALRGMGGATLLIRGSSRQSSGTNATIVSLARFDLALALDMLIPTLDPVTNTLQNVGVRQLNITTLNMVPLDGRQRRPLRRLLRQQTFRWAARTVETVVNILLPKVNRHIERVLAQTPLAYPALDNFPARGWQTRLVRNNTRVGGAILEDKNSSNSVAVFEVASDAAIRVVPMKG